MIQPLTCRREIAWLAAVLGSLAVLTNGVAAQPAAGAGESAGAGGASTVAATSTTSGDAAGLAEEIVVLRAVKPLKLSPEQLAALTTAVTQARDRLAQQAQTDLRTLAALREPAARARQQLLPEDVNLNDPQLAAALTADQQVANARRAAEQNQARLRDELSAALRQQFGTLLTPEQSSSMVAQGRAILAAERAQQDQQRQQRAQQFQQAMAARGAAQGGPRGGPNGGGRGGRGGPGGPGGRGPQGMMDRIRGMDADQYQQMSRGLAQRFGDPGTPAYQNALTMMDQIRSMPDDQFQQQRANLVQQFGAAMASGSSPANAASISDDHALETWIQRYLLSPQAPTALRDLSAAGSEGKGAS